MSYANDEIHQRHEKKFTNGRAKISPMAGKAQRAGAKRLAADHFRVPPGTRHVAELITGSPKFHQ
ncbi:hypothetical protein [Mycobacterium decipiens]|uniref:Uncharacterized protein n=1 Tax=Mycobacterium decipiens TaxID=1430326 RepID=A0A1X2LP47_9MYCO|nr:hypothetical protein [Mycobacterium decipiens]OSC36871.1 hypothetical protein B8W66_22350 [Mycobacterium decipiens]